MTAADTTVAARDAAGAPGADPAEVWIIGFHAWAAEVDAHWSLVERFASPSLDRNLVKGPINVGWHIRVAHDAQHSGCLIDTREW